MSENSQQKHVIVGMSGGVDSSVAAYLLLQQGYHVEGLFMKNWEEDDTDEYCSATEDRNDAQAVCDKLGIKLHTVNFAAEYWDNVFEHFLKEYSAGRTPNPDILCNKEIKFKAFLEYGMTLGADYIATGHYARNAFTDGQWQLLKGLDQNKDQSYFLYTLNQKQLSKSLFPIGELEKPEVRQIAKQMDFINHDKKDSTGICFIGERKFKDFLEKYIPNQPGDIISVDNEIVGKHSGLMYYTQGQRQGLNIGGLAGKSEQPWYVVDKNLETNQLIVAQGQEHPALYASSLICGQFDWVKNTPSVPWSGYAKIRYRQKDQACTIVESKDGKFIVNFNEPQRAITPGQSIVFYDGTNCLGGGIIESHG